jgi:hypothetical protein
MVCTSNGMAFRIEEVMLKEIFHIEGFKDTAEGFLNWWLSYTMSQPVSFDLTILCFFFLQYAGVWKIFEGVNEVLCKLRIRSADPGAMLQDQ